MAKPGIAPHFIKIFLPINIAALAGLVYFSLHFSTRHLLWMIAGWVLIGGYGIAVGYHRLFSHRSFQTYRFFEKLLAFVGVFAGQGSSLFWVGIHRGLHHPFSDTLRDLHSPIHGHFHAYVGWQMYLDPHKVTFKKCGDLLKDPWHVFIHKNYNRIFWSVILLALIINWKFALFFLIIPSFLSMHTENCVDLFCHLKSNGYRNFDTPDNSVNIWWLGYFGFGQGWHNNHHAAPHKPVYSHSWWELDLCSLLILPIKRKSFI